MIYVKLYRLIEVFQMTLSYFGLTETKYPYLIAKKTTSGGPLELWKGVFTIDIFQKLYFESRWGSFFNQNKLQYIVGKTGQPSAIHDKNDHWLSEASGAPKVLLVNF